MIFPSIKNQYFGKYSVSFPLPEMKDAMDASKAASSILTAVSEGELTRIEGNTCHGAYR